MVGEITYAKYCVYMRAFRLFFSMSTTANIINFTEVDMKIFKRPSLKSIVAVLLAIVIATGSFAALGGKAEAATKTYTVTWDGNGGKNANGQTTWKLQYAENTVLRPATSLFTRTGYTLNGFKANGKTYSLGSGIPVTKDMTVSAVWKANQYNINCYNAKYAYPQAKPMKQFNAAYNSYLLNNSNLPQPQRGYYRWWYNASNNTQITSSTRVTGPMSIYPVDKPRSISATFILDVEKDTRKVSTVTTGKSLKSAMPNPTKAGYAFVGWSLKKPVDGEIPQVYAPDNIFIVDKNSYTFYPVFVQRGGESQGNRTIDLKVTKSDLKNMQKLLQTRIDLTYKDYKKDKARYDGASFWSGLLGGVGAITAVACPLAGAVITCSSICVSAAGGSDNSAQYETQTAFLKQELTKVNGAIGNLSSDTAEYTLRVTAVYVSDSAYYNKIY